MKVSRPDPRPAPVHLGALAVLQAVFALRVGAQAIQSRGAVRWLPEFSAFQSGALPYRTLLVSQVAILVVQTWVVSGVSRGGRVLTGQRRVALGVFAAGYFAVMVLRLVAGSTVARGQSWLDNPLPSVFHLVLAVFLGVWVHYSSSMELSK